MKEYCLGIDIGGTSVKYGLFNRIGELLEKWSSQTNTQENGRYIIPEIAFSVNAALEKNEIRREQVAGAGVGVPGQVMEDGSILLAENIGWENVPLTQELEKLTGIKTYAENDANLAALGEIWRGSAKNFHSMVFVTLGTGIGCGIVVDDKIISGANGAAGEIGHMHMEDHMTIPCNCGKYGCLEQLASATGLRYLGNKALEASTIPSELRKTEVSARTIFEAVKQKDALAIQIVEKFGEYMGKALANCTCILNPEVIVIGGGVSKAGEVVLEYIEKYYHKYAYVSCADTKFKIAELGNDAGIFGGAKLAMKGKECSPYS